MALRGKAFESIVASDIEELVTNAVPEGLLIEYKQEVYGGADADKKEFLKDISAFANASGGHLIIGLPESGGVPAAPMPFVGDPDAEIRRMESLALASIQPRILGLRFRAVPMPGGGHCLVVRIPKSWNAPHRVIYQNSNRFYARRSASSPELSLDELRVAFTASTSAIERAQAFHAERVARIDSGDPIAPLVTGSGILVFHLIPLSTFGSPTTIDVDLARSHAQDFPPVGASGMRPRLNLEGFIYMDVPGTAYAQVFRNGIIESASIYIAGNFQNARWVSSTKIEQDVISALPRYIVGLDALGLTFPMLVSVTLLGVEGSMVTISETYRTFDNPEAIRHHQIDLPSIVLEEAPTGVDVWHRVLRPMFDALANASGLSRAHMFDDDGNWIRPKPVGT